MTNSIIYPVLDVNGSLKLPSSKPHIQRCLLLAFFNVNATEITNISWCTETSLLLDNLVVLGLKILEKNDDKITLQGIFPKQITPNSEVDAKGSGFVFRAMLSISALTDTLTIKCDLSLYSRESVLDKDFLAFLGVNVIKSDNELKFITNRTAVTTNKISVEKSSQFLSIAMMLSVYIPHYEIKIIGKNTGEGYIALTSDMLGQFGYQCKIDNIYSIKKTDNRSVHVQIPTDFTSLGYIMSLLSVMKKTSFVQIENYVAGNTHNEIYLRELFETLGVKQKTDNNMLFLESNRKFLKQVPLKSSLLELPSLATLIMSCSVFTHKIVQLTNIEHINNHKCQRIFVINENLRLLGLNTKFNFDKSGRFDGLHIQSNLELLGNVRLKSYRDHRVCAGNIVISVGCDSPNIVEDVDTLADGFPSFLEVITHIGIHSKPVLN